MAQQASRVSVVLVNYKGVEDTLTAIDYLRRLDWPEELLQIVVVDNASGDDSVARLRELGDAITLVDSKKNTGFAGGCNLGVQHADGEILGFLNNDARPDDAWISAAVAEFQRSRTVGAVASKVLDWEGDKVDFVDAGLTWYGMGYKPHTAEHYRGDAERPRDVLFGTGSAVFVRRSVYEELGGFDERYFMFFEDVDLGWRINLAGHRVRYVPASIAFHKHHASMAKESAYKETYLLERNALFTLYKNLGDDTLAQTLAGSLALAVRRGIARTGLDSTSLDLRKISSQPETLEVDKAGLATLFGIDQFVEELDSLTESRAQIQGARLVGDDRIRNLFGKTDVPAYQMRSYLEGYDKIVRAFDVIVPAVRRNVVIITGDPIGSKMAGPAIRAWNMALLLSREHDVTLVTLSQLHDVEAPFTLAKVSPGHDHTFRPLEAKADLIVFQGHAMSLLPSLHATEKPLVVDVYDPMHFEQLEQSRELGAEEWNLQVENATLILNEQLARGDFFLCASERQRYLYLGQLAALGRINPAVYANDPQLTHLIAEVPFGLDESVPPKTRKTLKGVVDGITEDDKVLIWSGGLYNWFDPRTLIRAVALLGKKHDNVRLFFQGAKHPHPGVPLMGIVGESFALAAELGVLGKSVIFNDSWVDYGDRHNYLLEADAGVSTHFNHIETTFSFRTRILDYLWTGLPMVVTEGDTFADLIQREGLGIVVPERDVQALADALEKALFDEDFVAAARENISRVREDFTWESVLQPLLAFARAPRRAYDAGDVDDAELRDGVPHIPKRRFGLRRDMALAWQYFRLGGFGLLLHKVRDRVGRRS